MYRLSHFVLAASAIFALSACGGGGSSPDITDRSATLTVSAASNPVLVGDYTSANVGLSDVERRNPSSPNDCSFRFDNLRKDNLSLFGEVRYDADEDDLTVVYISIDGTEFSNSEARDTEVNRDDEEVSFKSRVFRATDNSGATITAAGTLPMRRSSLSGC